MLLEGSLRIKLQKWFTGNHKQSYAANFSSNKMQIVRSLFDFPRRFTFHQKISDAGFHYDDEELVAWCTEAERWARVLFLHVEDEHQLEPLFRVLTVVLLSFDLIWSPTNSLTDKKCVNLMWQFIEEKGVSTCEQSSLGERIPVKYLIFLLSLVNELEFMKLSFDEYTKTEVKADSKIEFNATVDKNRLIAEKFANVFLCILVIDNL